MQIIPIKEVTSSKIVKIGEKYDFKILFNNSAEFEFFKSSLIFYFDYLQLDCFSKEEINASFEFCTALEERYDDIEIATFLYADEFAILFKLFWYAVDFATNCEGFNLIVSADYLQEVNFELNTNAKPNLFLSEYISKKFKNKRLFISKSLTIVSDLFNVAAEEENICDMEDLLTQKIFCLREMEKKYKNNKNEDIDKFIQEEKIELEDYRKEIEKEKARNNQCKKELNSKLNKISQSIENTSKTAVLKTLNSLVKKGVLDVSDAAKEMGLTVEKFKQMCKKKNL